MATSNVKLPDLINRWIEVQKKGTELERAKPLDIDAINLTLLLKSMGLRLQYLDFETEKSNADNLTITVKCNRSGMRAELSYELLRCSCPEKTDQESSFWEVQGTGPKVFSKCKNNASSNLLPDVSESCALVSKAMLANLLDYYEASIRQVKEGKEQAMLHSPLKSPRVKMNVVSPGLTIKKPFSTPPAEGKFSSRIESVAPVGGLDDTVEDDGGIETSTKELEKDEPVAGSSASSSRPESRSNTSAESVGINNKTHDLVSTDHPANKPVVDAVLSPAQTSVADDNAYEAMKTLVTSSPNERPVEAVVAAAGAATDTQHDRDRNVINCLQEARCQIDIALLLMKSNTTQDLTNGFGRTITPQHASAVSRKSFLTMTPKFAQPRSSSLLSIDRKRTPADVGVPKKTSSASSLPSSGPRLSIGSLAGRADTPRPSVAQVKSVAALRKPAGMVRSPGLSTGAQQSTVGGGLKKPPSGSIASLSSQRKSLASTGGTTTAGGRSIPKPPTSSSGRPAGAGLIQRSTSASYISKR
uniref:Uncharacterized protein n=1 Tax=Anopheles coluzzii TaxID=1518534 RepID=A0A6E8W3X5_ANOCL|nr:mucin-5AC-like [Anopheles coluzzii]